MRIVVAEEEDDGAYVHIFFTKQDLWDMQEASPFVLNYDVRAKVTLGGKSTTIFADLEDKVE